MEIGQVKNESGLLNEGRIVMDLVEKQPFYSKEQEKMICFLVDLEKINPALYKKLMDC